MELHWAKFELMARNHELERQVAKTSSKKTEQVSTSWRLLVLGALGLIGPDQAVAAGEERPGRGT